MKIASGWGTESTPASFVKFRVADIDVIRVFDCKCYGENVDMQITDYMVGFCTTGCSPVAS